MALFGYSPIGSYGALQSAPDPSTADLSQGGGFLPPVSDGAAVPPWMVPDAAPIQSLPDPSAPVSQAPAPTGPAPVMALPRPTSNGLLDAIDSVLLGGRLASARNAGYETRNYNYMLNQRGGQLSQFLSTLNPDQLAAYKADPQGFTAEWEKAYGPLSMKGGESTQIGGPTGHMISAPLVVTDNGRINSVMPGGAPGSATLLATTGPTVDASGVDTRTGYQFPINKPIAVPLDSSLQNFNPGGTGAPAPLAGGFQGGMMARPIAPSAPLISAAPTGAPPAPAPVTSPVAPAQAAVAGQIADAATKAGLAPADAATLVAIGKLESGLDTNAPKNGQSTGLYQFHPSTFAKLGGTNINDPNQQIQAAVNLYKQNQASLAGTLGRTPTATEMYLAHQQGLPAATALLTADPNANAVNVLKAAGVYENPASANKAILNNYGTASTTAGQFLATWQRKLGERMQETGVSPPAASASAAAPAPAATAPVGPGPAAADANLPPAVSAPTPTGAPSITPLVAAHPFGAPQTVMGADGKPLPGVYQAGPNGKLAPVDIASSMDPAEKAFQDGQGKAASDSINTDLAARAPALEQLNNAKQALAYVAAHPNDMNPMTPHLIAGANYLRSLPAPVLKAVGVDPANVNAAANDAGVYQRLSSQNLLSFSKTNLPSRYTEREMAVAGKVIPQLSTAPDAASFHWGLQAAMADKTLAKAQFAANYTGPHTQQAIEQAWQNSPDGQSSLFQDPTWSGVQIGGKPAVTQFQYKGQTYGIVGAGTKQPTTFKWVQ